MTTLSKEEFKLLLANSVASPDLDKVQDAIADLVAENERLKSVPMKYRRMAFNAELQDENKELRTALAAATNLLVDIRASLAVVTQDLVGSGCSLDCDISDIDDFLNRSN